MRKIILGNFKNNKVFRKKLRSSYRQAMRILRPQFGDNKGYDLVFCRKIWTYSDDGVDFYRRQNHAAFEICEIFRDIRNIDIRNAIIRAIVSENLRKLNFKNEFLMDILAVGGGFYLVGISKNIKLLPEIRKDFLEFSKNAKNYDFDKYMNGENEIEQDFLGFFAAEVVSKIVKNRKLNEISEQEIFDEIQKI